jgi:hypothetical protein
MVYCADVILCLHHFGCLGWAMRCVTFRHPLLYYHMAPSPITSPSHNSAPHDAADAAAAAAAAAAVFQVCEGLYPQEEGRVWRLAPTLRTQPIQVSHTPSLPISHNPPPVVLCVRVCVFNGML